MNIFKKLNDLSDLTVNEKLVADFINQHPREFIELKPKEIAQQTFVSLPTLYRLVSKLGLGGINDLKIEVATSIKEGEDSAIKNIDYPILPTDTHYQVMLNLKDVYQETLEETIDLSDSDVLLKASQLLLNAKVIDMYTTSANIFFAENFKFQMQEINVMVNVPKEEYTTKLTAANSTEQNVAIIISYGGRGKILHDVVKILKKNNTPIILITSIFDNPLKEYSTYNIYMSSIEDHYNKISSFSTRITLLFILDTLYSLYFKRDYDKNIESKLNNYKKINQDLL